jgi:hypothetical protein
MVVVGGSWVGVSGSVGMIDGVTVDICFSMSGAVVDAGVLADWECT